MAEIISQKSFSVRTIVNGRTLTFTLKTNQALTQILSKDPDVYTPNYASSNLIVTPVLAVSGFSGEQTSRLSDIRYTIKDSNGSNTTIKNAKVGNSLHIKENLVEQSGLVITCNANYVDPTTNSRTPVEAYVNVVKIENVGKSVVPVAYAPDGDCFTNKGGELRVKCDYMRGGQIDTDKITRVWKKNQGGKVSVVGSDHKGYNTDTLTIVPNDVQNMAVFECHMTDNDTSSTTYGQTIVGYVTIRDATDPYVIDQEFPQGDALMEGQTIKAYFYVLQGGKRVSSDFISSCKMFAFRYDPSGVRDNTWNKGRKELGKDNNRFSLSISSNDLHAQATTAFGVELER